MKRRRRSHRKRNRQRLASHARRLRRETSGARAQVRAYTPAGNPSLPLRGTHAARGRLQARRLNPAGFSFAFAGRGELLTLLLPFKVMPLGRARKSGRPPPFEPSFKVQRDIAHNQKLRVSRSPPGQTPQRARSFKGPV